MLAKATIKSSLKFVYLPCGITFGWMDAGCKFIVMKFCLMNKEEALRSVLAIRHMYLWL